LKKRKKKRDLRKTANQGTEFVWLRGKKRKGRLKERISLESAQEKKRRKRMFTAKNRETRGKLVGLIEWGAATHEAEGGVQGKEISGQDRWRLP